MNIRTPTIVESSGEFSTMNFYLYVFQQNCQPECRNGPSLALPYRNHILRLIWHMVCTCTFLPCNVKRSNHNLAGCCNVMELWWGWDACLVLTPGYLRKGTSQLLCFWADVFLSYAFFVFPKKILSLQLLSFCFFFTSRSIGESSLLVGTLLNGWWLTLDYPLHVNTWESYIYPEVEIYTLKGQRCIRLKPPNFVIHPAPH